MVLLFAECILSLHGFFLWICYGFFLSFSCQLPFGHGCVQSLIFQSHRSAHHTSHFDCVYSITTRYFHSSGFTTLYTSLFAALGLPSFSLPVSWLLVSIWSKTSDVYLS